MVAVISLWCPVTQILVSSAMWSILISFSMKTCVYASCLTFFFFFWAGSLWSVFVLFLLGIDFKEGTDKEGMPLWSDHPLQARSFTSVGFDLNAIQSIVPLLCGHTCFLGMRCVQGAGNSCFNRGPGVAKANTKANRGSTWTKAEQDVQPSRLGSSTKDTNRSLLDHEAMREDSGDVGLSCFSAL